MSKLIIHGRGAIGGVAEGIALVCKEPLQGWGCVDEKTEIIIEEGHPFQGLSIKGAIMVLSGGNGSTGWSCHFHAAKINTVGPGAMIFKKVDSRTGVAAAVLNIPVITDLEEDPFMFVRTGDWLRVDGSAGTIEITPKSDTADKAQHL